MISEFSASDKDATSDLVMAIDWELSKAFDRDNNIVEDKNIYMSTLTINETKDGQAITGSLELTGEDFIDYEKVAELVLVAYVEDKERELNRNEEKFD